MSFTMPYSKLYILTELSANDDINHGPFFCKNVSSKVEVQFALAIYMEKCL